jgi:pyruvate dehydrogenase E1 component
MTLTAAQPGSTTDQVLREIEQRLLWLATAIVDHANRVRPNPSGLKVGGHQASSASMVTIMTSLWLEQLQAEDRVSVKPHASPVLHALEYLLGQLDASHLTTLREFGGLQSYPSRLKDPVPADYSTGSVGIGATAPIWGAIARRYVNTQLGAGGTGRQWSLVGDAELDEGAVWEAVVDPMVAELGEVVWVVDLNRQSLDRVVPTMGATRLQGMFAAAGWQVLTVKYGRLLEELFARPGGAALRARIDEMSNPEYQRLLRHHPADLRRLLPGDGPGAAEIDALVADVPDADLAAAVRNLGGHDLAALRDAFAQIDDTRPTVVLAYTLKGYGLATEGHPQNHSALLTEAQLHELAARLGVDPADPWAGFPGESAPARLLADAAQRLRRRSYEAQPAPQIPADLGRTPSGTATTQAALGRALLDLNRAAPDAGRRVVTVSPDVSSSTNLGGWVNKVGVWSHEDRRNWFADDAETILHWRERPSGQHIELGIAETNLVGTIGELGATWSRWGQPLLPIGVLYDPFVERALEPWSFGIYAGGQSILVGTPSGVTLASEGGATSRSPRRRSGWSSPAASPTSRRSPWTPSGACSPRWPGWADPTGPRPTCDSPPARSTSHWPPSPPTRPPASDGGGTSWPVRTRCGTTSPTPASRWSRWAPSSRRCWPRPTGWATWASARTSWSSPAPGCCSGHSRPAAGWTTPRPGSSTQCSPPTGRGRWSPSWTGTRTPWRSSPASAVSRPRTSVSRSSVRAATSRRCTRCTAWTPTR